MSYEIDPTGRIPDEIRRVATELVTRALDGLRASDVADRHTAVHDARKRGKELRALLRLLRGVMGHAARDENAVVRDAGRTLSDVRDASSVVECVDALLDDERARVDGGGEASTADEASVAAEASVADEASVAAEASVADEASVAPETVAGVDGLAGLREALVARRTRMEAELDLDSRVDTFTLAFEGVAARIPSWPVDAATLDALVRAAARRYGRGRKELAVAASSGDREAYHEWRKRVKDHRYHLRLLRPLWPPVLSAAHAEVKALSDHLGDEHDLTVVEEIVAADPALLAGVDEGVIRAAIARRRSGFRSAALGLGRLVYAEGRSALEMRLRAYAARW